METQNHTNCKRNYTLLFFLHLRGTNHIAGSRLSIGKAGYSKEQDKKKDSFRPVKYRYKLTISFPFIYDSTQPLILSYK